MSSSGKQVAEVTSVSPVTTGVWYHVACVRGSNFLQLYFNGQLERQASVGFAQNYGNYPLYFGSSGQSYWDRKFKGLLDEVSLYNRALASNEIAAIYAAGAAGKCKVGGGLSIITQPQGQTVVTGSNAVFTVIASGADPISYQWRYNGADLADGGQFSGSRNSTLTISAVQPANEGDYSVVVTNTSGALTSSVAVLTVAPAPTAPSITTQPVSQTVLAGSNVTFSVAAEGTSPLTYRWRKGGNPLNNGGNVTRR